MKDPKKTGAGKGTPEPPAAKPAPMRAPQASGKADPRTAPVPTAPPSVSAGALKTLAAVRESTTVEPKQASKPVARPDAPKPPAPVTKPSTGAGVERPAGKPAGVEPAAARPAGPKAVDQKSPPIPPAPKPVQVTGPAHAKPVEAKAPAPPEPQKPASLRVVETMQPAPPTPTAPTPRPIAQTEPTAPTPRPIAQSEPTAPPPAATAIGAEPASMWLDTAGWAELNTKMLDLMRSQTEANFAIWRSTLGAGSLSEAIRMQTTGVREAYETTAAQWRDIAETAARLMGGGRGVLPLPWTRQGR